MFQLEIRSLAIVCAIFLPNFLNAVTYVTNRPQDGIYDQNKILGLSGKHNFAEKVHRCSSRSTKNGGGQTATLLTKEKKNIGKWLDTDALVAFIWVTIVFGKVMFQRRKRQWERQIYATQLSEVDRTRAQVLQRSYDETKICPICLDDFSSTLLGSDGHPIQLLRCGHVFDKTCYQKWVSLGCGDVTKCPVCRADVGPTFNDHPVTVMTISSA